jgi:serine/threonine-protein kinase
VRTIGGYAVLGLLGRGGMGAVYKVRHLALGRAAALKLLAPADELLATAGAAELERRFLAEARTMAALHHPNIAPVWDLGRDRLGRPYFVMDYGCTTLGGLIGETYLVEAPSRTLPLPRAADIASQTLEGLARLHYAGIVHRDVKPFNLLLDGLRVRLIDFGLSRLRGERMALHPSEKVGSPFYAAPEQEADPEAADARSDLYAVGVTLVRMLTGRLPLPGAPRPSALNPDLDADWDAFLAQACAADPARRFPSANAMAAALEALLVAWNARAARACALPSEPAAPAGQAPALRRRAPLKTGPRTGPEAFGLDALWRPRAYPPRAFRDQGDGTVAERESGLLWEREGTPYAVEYAQALEHVAGLNARRLGGEVGWRLPTVPELATLLRPVARERAHCLEPVFDPARARLWSADRRTFQSAWTADAELGHIAHHDLDCRLFARAVRG